MSPALEARGSTHHACCGRVQQPARHSLRHMCHAASPGSSVELRRVLQMQQLLDEATAAPPESPDEQAGSSSSSSKPQSRGFGRGNNNSSKTKRAPLSKEEWQTLRSVGAAEPCPCCSGLKYQDCCQPFLSGAAAPRSAPELVRARLAAGRIGNVSYLAATTHPDSVLALGGARDTASRYKRQCAMFKANQVVVVGMAHCRGDFDGSWVVLTILQSTTADGELAGTKAPQMALLVRRDWQETPQAFGNLFPGGRQAAGAAAGPGSRNGDEQQPWMFLKYTNQFPEHGDAEVLVQLIQQHVPEVLLDGDGSASQQQQQMTGRQLCFSWSSPWLSPSPGQPAHTGWYVDMMQPAAERLGGGSIGGSSGSGQGGGLRLLLPPGVLNFDDLMADK